MHGSRFRFQVPVPVSLYRCIAVSLFSSSPIIQRQQNNTGYAALNYSSIQPHLIHSALSDHVILFANGCLSRILSRGFLFSVKMNADKDLPEAISKLRSCCISTR